MKYFNRIIESKIHKSLDRGKSILLMGPRQVGKTTLVKEKVHPDISYSFAKASTRNRYEKDISLFEKELELEIQKFSSKPLVFIDEVQKIPRIMDSIQVFIDDNLAQFILTGSSARKLKYGELNLLPGRIVVMMMAPLLYEEIPDPKPSLEELLLYGTIPNIITEKNNENRETDLQSYVYTYLEEEIRAEAAARNVGHFSRFLELAAGESGKQLNFSRLSQDIGVAQSTIAHYYQILEDTLIASRIDPIANGNTKRRLIKSPRYLFYDSGIRRACAGEGVRLPLSVMGDLFEYFIGNILIYYSHYSPLNFTVKYWKDSAGPEVDFVLEVNKTFVPIEVKWSEHPKNKDARHLIRFLNEYPDSANGYVVCRTPKPYKITDQITALPWQNVVSIFNDKY